MALIEVKIDGGSEFERVAARFKERFTPETIAARAVMIAQKAGVVLYDEVIGQLVHAIYAQPAPEVLFSGSGLMDHGAFGDTETRSGDLHDAHKLHDLGMLQEVAVDMDMPVSADEHSGRTTVGDYATAVHDGYMQFIPTKDGGSMATGTFHPGRPWMDRASFEGFDLVSNFVAQAFFEAIEVLWTEAFA